MAFHVWKKALGCTTFHPHWKAFFNPKAPLLAQKHDALRLDPQETVKHLNQWDLAGNLKDVDDPQAIELRRDGLHVEPLSKY